jgi:hypothetical protein
MKACWADDTLLPGECVFDTNFGDGAEIYNCSFAQLAVVTDKDHCRHWMPDLSEYTVHKRLPDIANPCIYTEKHCTHFTKGGC